MWIREKGLFSFLKTLSFTGINQGKMAVVYMKSGKIVQTMR